MDQSFTDEFFCQLYKWEWERRDKQDSADSFLLASTALLGGVGAYYAKLFPSPPADAFGWWFAAGCIVFWPAIRACGRLPNDYCLAKSRRSSGASSGLSCVC